MIRLNEYIVFYVTWAILNILALFLFWIIHSQRSWRRLSSSWSITGDGDCSHFSVNYKYMFESICVIEVKVQSAQYNL